MSSMLSLPRAIKAGGAVGDVANGVEKVPLPSLFKRRGICSSAAGIAAQISREEGPVRNRKQRSERR
jgi:hypothetical protein